MAKAKSFHKRDLERIPYIIPAYKPEHYSGKKPSSPFKEGLGKCKEARKLSSGDGERNDFFEKVLMEIWDVIGRRTIPYAFIMADGEARSLDLGCIGFFSKGRLELKVVRDDEGYIIGVSPSQKMIDRYERRHHSAGGVSAKDDDFKNHKTTDFMDNEGEEEGKLVEYMREERERNSDLVKRKKEKFLSEHGRLFCEACGFDFEARYGKRGHGFMECHHIKPLSELEDVSRTKLSDLVLLCSNCHRMIHLRKPWLTLDDLRKIIKH